MAVALSARVRWAEAAVTGTHVGESEAMVIGNVKKTKIGRTKALANPKTKATNSAEMKLVTVIPGTR